MAGMVSMKLSSGFGDPFNFMRSNAPSQPLTRPLEAGAIDGRFDGGGAEIGGRDFLEVSTEGPDRRSGRVAKTTERGDVMLKSPLPMNAKMRGRGLYFYWHMQVLQMVAYASIVNVSVNMRGGWQP
jgi:hypothetical protein